MNTQYTSTLTDFLFKSAWLTVIGNSIEYEKYTGVETGNPSGSTENVKKEIYKDGLDVIQFVNVYTYDIVNDILKITCTES